MRTPRLIVRALFVASLVLSGTSCSEGAFSGATLGDIAYLTVVLPATNLRVGQKTSVSVSLRNASGTALAMRPVSWTTTNPAVATVSSDGQITATGPGATMVVATVDGASGSATLSVADAPAQPNNGGVASVSITFDATSLAAGQSTQAAVVLRDAQGNPLSDRVVVWESSNPAVATVSPAGVITAVGPGPVTITATSEGMSGSFTFTVLPAPPVSVADVYITVGSTVLQVGQSTTATAVARDVNGNVLTGRVVTWSSSNPAVAAVSSLGVVTAGSIGSANISGTSEGHSGQVAIVVQTGPPGPPPASAPVASMAVSLSASNVDVGQTVQATAIARDGSGNVLTGRTIVWTSNNNAIATVSSNGVVTAVGAGLVSIVGTSEGVSANAPLTVDAPIATIAVSLSSSSLQVGQTAQATAIVRDATGKVLNGKSINWTSTNPNVAAVSSSGVVTGVGAGSATITGSNGTKAGSASLSVVAPPTPPPPSPAPVATVSVSLASSSLQIGQSTQATAVTRDASNIVLTGRVVTWSSSNTGIATVSSSGVVTAVAAGSATISATSETKTGGAGLAVQAPAPVPVSTVTVSLGASTLQTGQTTQGTAVTRDAGGNVLTGRVVTWSSSNTAIASVSNSGVVTALAAGSATITATSETRTGGAPLTVQAPAPVPVATVSVSLAASTLQVGQNTQATAVARDASGNVLTGRPVTWSSSNTAVATVTSGGVVTAVAAGTVTISGTSETKVGGAALTSQSPPPPPPPPVGGGAPEPGASDVILHQDLFNRSTGIANGYTTRGNMVSIPDGHSGQAIRFPYTASSWDNLLEKGFPQSNEVYVRYWYRTSVGADPTCHDQNQSGFKWFMLWRPDPNPRYTFGVHNLDENVNGRKSAGLEFSAHDNSLPDAQGSLQNVTTTPRFATTNDGQWHKFTLRVIVGTGGYEQMWVDDVLIMDTSRYPTRNHSSIGLSMFQFPGTMVAWYSGCEFNLDIDDFVVWHR